MMTFEMLTGQTRDHVINFAGNHHLQFNATKAFLAMQKAAATAGFKLMPASSFRDFSRQQIIWNEKFAGVRTVNDAENRPLDVSGLSEAERCQAILRWSAIPVPAVITGEQRSIITIRSVCLLILLFSLSPGIRGRRLFCRPFRLAGG